MAILAGNNFNIKDFAPALWLDAADSNTLYDAVSGGALVGAGGAVARWEDKSGNGRHATQSNSTRRPLRVIGSQNTRDSLRFDGINDFLTCGDTLDVLTNGVTLLCVAKFNNTDNGGLLGKSNPNTAVGRYSITRASGNLIGFATFNTTGSGTGNTVSVADTSTDLRLFSFRGNRGTSSTNIFKINGRIIGTANYTGTTTSYDTTDQFFIGSYQNITGPNTSTLWPANADICEALVFLRDLTDVELQSIERYLANKWGLGFNPLSLSPALWLDASDSNTLYDATTGGALVGAGGAVARWEDKSGNARHATQATLANRPLRTAAAQGGKDALTFDGSNDFMATPAFGGTQDCTYFLVAASKNATQLKVFAAHANNYENPPLGANFVAVNAARLETGQNGASGTTKFTSKLAASQNLQNNIFRVINTQLTSTNAGHIQRVNGAAHATTNAYPQDPGVFTKAAQSFGVGAYNTGGLPCHCDIAELIYFTKLLTASERQAIERYLAQKWNIIT